MERKMTKVLLYILLPVRVILVPVYYCIFQIIRFFNEKKQKKFDNVKIVCVGNHILGGSGKTTIVSFFTEELVKKGKKLGIVMRGYKRKNKVKKVPPYLEIIEEAHNFAPEKVKAKHALSKNMIELLAREGRKFFASLCLVSQRPIHLSTTALSQCNTQIFLRITNPYDLDHIGKSSEALTPDVLDSISGLRVGEALIVGEATNWPVFIRVRKRISKEVHGESLENYASYWEKSMMKKLAKGAEFL
jgi:hypothetical protein